MSELDDIANRWRRAWDEGTRAAAIRDLFVAGIGNLPAPIEGASRALLHAGRACAEANARAHTLERALRAALLEPRSPWTLQTLADLAGSSPNAFIEALAVARDRPKPKDTASTLLARASVETLASLVAVAPHDLTTKLFSETLAGAKAIQYDDFNLPYLLARASPGIGPVDPDTLLAAVDESHRYYRALGYALVAKDLPDDARRRAVVRALSDPDDPSLGDARPFVALAAWLDAETYPRALELAAKLYSSPSFGATAMRALLPGWAKLGQAEDAIARARTIAVDLERGIALGNIAAHLGNEARDELVLEALSLFDAAKDGAAGVAAVAESLVPLGYGSLLLDSKGGDSARLALATYATGAERATLLEETRFDVRYLQRFVNELDPKRVFEPWFHAFSQASAGASDGTFFEDEYGTGFGEWMFAVPILAGSEGLREVANVIVP